MFEIDPSVFEGIKVVGGALVGGISSLWLNRQIVAARVRRLDSTTCKEEADTEGVIRETYGKIIADLRRDRTFIMRDMKRLHRQHGECEDRAEQQRYEFQAEILVLKDEIQKLKTENM